MLIRDLLRRLQTDPGQPRLTWYGHDNERIELSGAVLANWVAKTTNLLVEEFDAQPDTHIGIDLPVHWRTATWALAVWQVGATAVLMDDELTGETHKLDVIVTHRPQQWMNSSGQPRNTSADMVVVSLPALARQYNGDLPSGAIDAASAVMTYADQVLYAPSLDQDQNALIDTTQGAVAHRDLVPLPDPVTAAERVLLDGRSAGGAILRELLRVWAGAGSAVLISHDRAELLDQDMQRKERLLETEKVVSFLHKASTFPLRRVPR